MAGERLFHIIAGREAESTPAQVERRGTNATRKIVLLDLENMMFGRHEDHAAERSLSEEVLRLAEARRPSDMVILGCNPHLAFSAKTLFPGAQIVTGKGKDGADLALIETIDLDHASDRFDELCIVSGDNAFAPVAHAARKAGMQVRVVAPHFGLSTALRVYAHTSVILSRSEDPNPAAA